jgi:hypothetical protein
MAWGRNSHIHVSDGAGEVNFVCVAILLVLCFWVPVQPILPIKTYRLVEVIVVLFAAVTFAVHGAVRFPLLIRLSFWIGLAGWMVSTAFSPDLKRSIDVGTLEFLIFYVVLYLAAVHLRGQRDQVIAAILFAAGAAVIAITQTVSIVLAVQEKYNAMSVPISLPFSASDFIRYKGSVPQVFPAGVTNSYGNIDNYASLCALLLPWLLGLFYVSRHRWLVLILFLVHAYAGLVVYSRGTVLAFVAAVCALWIFRFRACGRLSPAICAVLFGTAMLHADHKVISSFSNGITSFTGEITGRPVAVENKSDKSPAERAQALSVGVSTGFKSSMMGVGYGAYPMLDSIYTAPHSLAVLRFAEGGLLSLIAFAMLAMYAPWRLLQVLKRREKNMLEAACLCAASAFFAKAIIFGASFSVSSNFVWGFGLALCIAGSLWAREDPAVMQVDCQPAT